MVADYAQLVFYHYFKSLGSKVDELRTISTNELLSNYLYLMAPPVALTSSGAINTIEDLQNGIETKMKEIVSEHHSYFWLHLYRRLAPRDTFGDENPVTVSLYRNIMESACLKYGSGRAEDEFVTGGNVDPNAVMSGVYAQALREFEEIFGESKSLESLSGAFIKNFGLAEFIQLLSLEKLAHEYWRTTVCLRRIYKGGKLVILKDAYYVENSREEEHLMNSYDKRNATVGSSVTLSGIPLTDGAEAPGFCLLPRYNTEGTSARDLQLERVWKTKWLSEQFPPNFAWVRFDMNHYYVQHAFLTNSFESYYGFSLECLVSCLYALSMNYWMSCRLIPDPRALSSIMQRAYVYTTFTAVVEGTYDWLQKSLNSLSVSSRTVGKEEMEKCLAFFTLRDGMRDKISLTNMGPRPLLTPLWDDNVLLDFTAIMPILGTVMHPLRADMTGKGRMFEDYVLKKLKLRGRNVWRHQCKLKGSDGTEKEIDLALKVGSMMFICEIRTIAQSFSFHKGEFAALAFRKAKLEKLLSECKEKCEWLAKHPEGTNFSLPRDTLGLVPLGVSPFVEYIWSSNEYYWLTEEIPRLCTPDELIRICTRDCLPEIVKRSYVTYVSR